MRSKAWVAVLAVVALAVSATGCLTVFPARSLLTTDPRTLSPEYENVLAYEAKQNPSSSSVGACTPGTDVRTILVPPRSVWVSVYVFAKISPVPQGTPVILVPRFDLSVKDGNQTTWVDVHLQGNDTNKEYTIDGPRPGGWTVSLSYNVCDSTVLKIDDQFVVRILVRQPT